MRENWGVDYPMQHEEIRERCRQTCIENYGEEYPMKNESVREKFKQTCIERYGVDHVFKSDAVKEKCRRVLMDRYGVEYPLQHPGIREKWMTTCQERYGSMTPLQSDAIKSQIVKTNQERYGVSNVFECPDIQKKIRETNQTRYGVENVGSSEEIKRRIRETVRLRYNVENVMHDAEISERCFDGCFRQKEFTFPVSEESRRDQGQTTTRCASHKKIGMMRCPTSKCIVRGCGEYAHFGLLGEIMPHFCELHTPDTSEYINLVEQKCNNCGLLNILGKDMMCIYCSPIGKSYRREKQEYMKSWLIKKSYDILSYDKPIDGFKCGRERPDFLLQNFDGSLSIIIEVDEYQHMFSGYTDECERTRMRNIAEAIGHPTVFLRFNPDGYRPRANHKQIRNLLERYDVFDKVLHKYKSIDQHDLKSLPGVVFYIHLFFDDFNVDDIGDNIYVLVPHE